MISDVRAESVVLSQLWGSALSEMEVCSVSSGDMERGCGLAQRYAKTRPRGTPISTVWPSVKSPTLSDPQIPHLWLRKNSECLPMLLLHWGWVLKPLRFPWLWVLRVLARLLSKDKMGIGNTDVTRGCFWEQEMRVQWARLWLPAVLRGLWCV